MAIPNVAPDDPLSPQEQHPSEWQGSFEDIPLGQTLRRTPEGYPYFDPPRPGQVDPLERQPPSPTIDPNQVAQLQWTPRQEQQPPQTATDAPTTPLQWVPRGAAPKGYPSPKEVLSRGAQDVRKSAGDVGDVWSRLRQEQANDPDKDIDYETGIDYRILLDLKRATNPDEAKLVLQHYYGEGNFGQDKHGKWWVMQDVPVTPPTAQQAYGPRPAGREPKPQMIPRRVSVEPQTWAGTIKDLGAGMGASSTVMGGGMLGAAAGAPAGPVGSFLGLGAGAAAGWAADQAIKAYRGFFSQTPTESLKGGFNEAALNMAMGLVAPAWHAGRSAVASFGRRMAGTTPYTEQTTQRMVAEGLRPPLYAVAPRAYSLADKEKLATQIAGNPWEATHVAYVHREMREAFRAAGYSDDEITRAMDSVLNITSAQNPTQVGRSIVQASQGRVGGMRAEIAADEAQIDEALRRMNTALSNWARQPVGRLGPDVANQVVAHRQRFSNIFKRAYENVDGALGNRPVIDRSMVFAEARNIVDSVKPELVPPYIKQIDHLGRQVENAQARVAFIERAQQQVAQLQAAGQPVDPGLARIAQQGVSPELRAAADPRVTFAEGHELRTNLRELAGHGINLTRTPWDRKIDDMARSVDAEFRAMEVMGGLEGHTARRLRSLDHRYSKGIARYYDTQIQQLTNAIRSGHGPAPDPQIIADMVLRMGREESAVNIMRMLTPEMREKVGRAHFRGILENNSAMDRTGNFSIVGDRLFDAIESNRPFIRMYMTDRDINNLSELARHFAARQGKLDARFLGDIEGDPVGLRNVLQRQIANQQNLDEFLKGNPIAKFSTGRPEMIDRAFADATTPNKTEVTETFWNFLPQQARTELRQYALEKLFREAIVQSPSKSPMIGGNALENALKKYTARQQEILFGADDITFLRRLAQDSRFLFPEELTGDWSTGMAAKAITLHTGIPINQKTWNADAKWMTYNFVNWLMKREPVYNFLSGISKDRDPSDFRRTLGLLGRWYFNSEMMGPGRGRPTERGVNGNRQ